MDDDVAETRLHQIRRRLKMAQAHAIVFGVVCVVAVVVVVYMVWSDSKAHAESTVSTTLKPCALLQYDADESLRQEESFWQRKKTPRALRGTVGRREADDLSSVSACDTTADTTSDPTSDTALQRCADPIW
jgi:hypothetical protein